MDINIKQTINSVYLGLIPILGIYVIYKSIDFPFVISIILVMFSFTNKNRNSRNEKLLFSCILVLSFIGLICNSSSSWFSLSLFANNTITLTITFLALIYLSHNLNKNLFLHVTEIVGIISSIAVIIQRFFIVLGNPLDIHFFYLPGVEMFRPIETISTIRPSCFFPEPAHLCIYLLPVFCCFILKRNFINALLVGFGMLCSSSSTGFLMMFIILIAWSFRNSTVKSFLAKLIVILTLFGVGAYLIISFMPEILLDNTAKLAETDAMGNSRLLGHAKALGYFSFFNFVFGIGLNQLSNLYSSHGIHLGVNGNYSNSMLYMLISFGITGFVILIRYIISCWKLYPLSRLMIIVLIGVLASDQILFDYKFVYLLTYIYSFSLNECNTKLS